MKDTKCMQKCLIIIWIWTRFARSVTRTKKCLVSTLDIGCVHSIMRLTYGNYVLAIHNKWYPSNSKQFNPFYDIVNKRDGAWYIPIPYSDIKDSYDIVNKRDGARYIPIPYTNREYTNMTDWLITVRCYGLDFESLIHLPLWYFWFFHGFAAQVSMNTETMTVTVALKHKHR